MAGPVDKEHTTLRYAHLSEVHPEWTKLASQRAEVDKLADKLHALPLPEFRKVPYTPPPLPIDAPVLGKDINVTEAKVVVRDGQNVGIRIYKPVQVSKQQVLFYNVHGGGWTVGNPQTEEAQNRLVAAKAKAVVVSVDYRKAPEFPFPYALNDSLDVLRWCIANAETLGIDPERIIIGGGSAGANIVSDRFPLQDSYALTPSHSAVIANIARDEGISGIVGQVLNIPVTCHPAHFPASKYEYQSYEQNANAPIVSAARMRLYWDYYLPSAEADPRASPLLEKSFEGLPPTLIQIAGMDPLRDEGLAYAEALKAAGVDVTSKVYPGLPHAFYIYPEIQPTTDYFQTVVDWIDHVTQRKLKDKTVAT